MTDEEKKPYHQIMTSAWRLFIKERKAALFSEEWWREIIGDYDKLREPYKGTIYDDYCGDISQAFLDQWEKLKNDKRPERVLQKVLSEKQGYHQEQLPIADSVSEMGRSKETYKPLSASDWG